jgi:hypothetical protein
MRQHYSFDHEKWVETHFAGRDKPVKLSSAIWFYEKPKCSNHDAISFSTWNDLQLHLSTHGRRGRSSMRR